MTRMKCSEREVQAIKGGLELEYRYVNWVGMSFRCLRNTNAFPHLFREMFNGVSAITMMGVSYARSPNLNPFSHVLQSIFAFCQTACIVRRLKRVWAVKPFYCYGRRSTFAASAVVCKRDLEIEMGSGPWFDPFPPMLYPLLRDLER